MAALPEGGFYYIAKILKIPKGIIVNATPDPIYFCNNGLDNYNVKIVSSLCFDNGTGNNIIPHSIPDHFKDKEIPPDTWYIVSKSTAQQLQGKPRILFRGDTKKTKDMLFHFTELIPYRKA